MPSIARKLRRVLFFKEVMKLRPPSLTILVKPILYISRNERFPKPGGIVPSRRLSAIHMTFMLVRLCKDHEILLVNLLMQKLKSKRFGSLIPISLGISPHTLLEAKAKETREEMLYIDGGIVPERLLIVRSSSFKFWRWPNSLGIAPPRVGAQV